MARRSNYMPLLAGLLVLGIIIGIAAYTVHRSVSPLLRLPLLAEEQGRVEVARGTVYAGYVYNVSWTPSGWAFKAKTNTRLVEKLQLTGVDLQPGDAMSWHGWDLYNDGVGDYVDTGFVPSDLSFTVAVGWKPLEYTNPSAGISMLFGRYSYMSQGWWLGAVPNLNGFQFEAYNSSSVVGQVILGQFSSYFGQWMRVAVRFQSSGTVDMWMGGSIAAGPNTVSSDIVPPSSPLLIYHANTRYILSYAIYFDTVLGDTEVADLTSGDTVLVVKPAYMFDPTWWNGTHFFDIVSGIAGTPYGNVARLPAEQTWLWLVKNLASDGKLHLKWFPPNTIIRVKDSAGNVIREWTIPEVDANAAGLVEDYAVDLAADVLPSVTIEASIPAQKARIYGPPGFTIRVETQSYAQEYTIGSEGYVDVPVEGDSATVALLAASKSPQLGISVYESDGKLRVQVYNASNGVALSGAVVIAKKNNEAASATTDENGFATLSLKPDASITIEAYYLNGGVVYTGSAVYMPPPADYDQPLPESNSNRTAAVLIVLLLLMLLAVVMLRRGRR